MIAAVCHSQQCSRTFLCHTACQWCTGNPSWTSLTRHFTASTLTLIWLQNYTGVCHTACQWLGHRCVLYGSDSANTAYLQHLWRSSSIRFSLMFAKLQQKHNMTLMLCFWFISYKINTKIPVRKKLNNSNITHSLANKTCSWGIQYSNVLVLVVNWLIVAHCSSVPAAALASVLLRL